jgi:hypothetical protein
MPNIIFLIVAAALAWRFLRASSKPMLRMMNSPLDETTRFPLPGRAPFIEERMSSWPGHSLGGESIDPKSCLAN